MLTLSALTEAIFVDRVILEVTFPRMRVSISKLSKVLLALVVAAIFGQSVVCFAENADLLSCIHEARQNCDEASSGQSDQSPDEGESGGCQHLGCHKLISVSALQTFVVISDKYPATYFSLKSFVPDSPVSEIDYPPQLS